MAGSASNYLENKLIDHALGTATYTKPTSVYIALYSVMPSDSSSGTEVTGGSYVRKIATFNVASGGSATNNANIDFTSMPTITVVGVGVLDAVSSGNLLFWSDLPSPISVISGDTVRIASGALSISLD